MTTDSRTWIGDLDLYLAGEGRHEELYGKLGAHVLGTGPERAHDDVAVRRVRAEQMVRVGMVPPDDELELVFQRHAASSSSRRMPATGTGTQSGRWASS